MSKDYVYVFVCPLCGKRIISSSFSQVEYNARLHINKHKLGYFLDVEKHILVREIE